MSIPIETKEFDPFARGVPGQSFTDEPGLRPYERPPQSSDPERVIQSLEKELLKPETSKALVDLMEVGVSVQTLAEGFMQKCFAEGVCSADVAELAKPAIFMIIAQIGDDADIDDIALFNELPERGNLSDEQKVGLMSQLAPHKFKKLQDDMRTRKAIQEDYSKEMDNRLEGVGVEEEEGMMEETVIEEPSEGFINRTPEVSSGYEEELV
jgi:hypothetical protein